MKCDYCHKEVAKDSLVMKMRRHRKPKHRKEVPYHKKCWSSMQRLTGQRKWNVSNPLGGYR